MCKYIFNPLFCFMFAVIILCHITEPESKWEGTKSDKAKGMDTRRPLVQSVHHRPKAQEERVGLTDKIQRKGVKGRKEMEKMKSK